MKLEDVVFLRFKEPVALGNSSKYVGELTDTDEWDLRENGDCIDIIYKRYDLKHGFVVETCTSVNKSNIPFMRGKPVERQLNKGEEVPFSLSIFGRKKAGKR